MKYLSWEVTPFFTFRFFSLTEVDCKCGHQLLALLLFIYTQIDQFSINQLVVKTDRALKSPGAEGNEMVWVYLCAGRLVQGYTLANRTIYI